MYLAVISQPDIATSTTTISQYISNPREQHITAVRHIMKYLRGTSNIISSYSNADYGGDLDDRKSRSGCVVMLNEGPIIWFSCKQKCVATSTTESKYISTSITSKETVWARRLMIDMGFPQPKPTPHFSDNQVAIRLVMNSELHKRSKHVDIAFYKIR
jgi:hypothetical protein